MTPTGRIPPADGPGGWPPLVVFIVLTALMAVGALLRLHDLGSRPLRQGEIFVPGIALPAGVSSPEPMLTARSTVAVLMRDIHPPPWYLGMLFWTRLAGTSLFAIRLPSALFGVLAIALAYWVAVLETDRQTALLSAALLAFNGHHILYSQIARPYSIICLAGLCSTAFLLLAHRPGPRRLLWAVSYGIAILVGVSSHHYFWPFFISQIVWVFVAGWRESTPRHGLLRLQLLVLILASPLAAIAVFQSRHPYLESYLHQDAASFLADFMRFAFLFEPDGNPVRPFPETLNLAFFAGSILLVVLGLIRLGRVSRRQRQPVDFAGPSLSALAAAATCACSAIIAVALILRRTPVGTSFSLITAALPVGPLAVAASLNTVDRYRARRLSAEDAARSRFGWPLISWLSIVPALALAAISLSIKPFLAWKGMLVYSPYVLMVLAAGLTTVARWPVFGRALALAIAVLLAAGHVISVQQSYKTTNPQDYQGLAAMWRVELQDGDVVFALKNWETTPVFYYLDVKRYHFVAQGFASSVEHLRPSRVWVLLHEGDPVPDQISVALAGYVRTRVFVAPRVQVALYLRPA